jgi:hypothetical protein
MYHLNFTIQGNPDRGESDWEENHSVSAGTMKELREKVLKFQGEQDIGGGNWGEAVLRHDDALVGYVSYNLRVWKTPYWEEGREEVVI